MIDIDRAIADARLSDARGKVSQAINLLMDAAPAFDTISQAIVDRAIDRLETVVRVGHAPVVLTPGAE